MSIVSITGSASTAGVPTISQAVPATVQDGDLGVAIIHQNTNTNTFTPPTGWTLVETRGPLGGNNCITYLLTKNTPFAASDAGSNVTGSFTTPSPHCGIVLAVLRGVTLDGAPVGFSDDTADTSVVFGSYTPTNNSEDVLLLAGVTTTSSQGVYTISPPSGFTEDVDTNGGFTSGANTGVWAAHLTTPTTGTGGVSQSIGNGTATKLVRANAWAIPLAPAVTNASVTGVAATGTAAAVIPAVSGEIVITGGGPAGATAVAFTPLVGVDAAVMAPAATATAGAVPPTLHGGTPVTATDYLITKTIHVTIT